MTDLIAQTREYLETVRIRITVDVIVAHPVSSIPDSRRRYRGPWVALSTGVVVALIGLFAVLLQPSDSDIVRSHVVEPVVEGAQDGSQYAVGFDGAGVVCAEAGEVTSISKQSQGVCGDSDQPTAQAYEQVAAAAFQGDTSVALAGWAPASSASITAVYDGELRRSLELTPIPGFDVYAFGAIESGRAEFIEIEIRDAKGEILQRYFPAIGPSD